MYIKNNMTDTEGFKLDIARIGSTSSNKTKIVLDYNGPLPVELSDTTSATITFMLRVGLAVNVILTVNQGGKRRRYPVEATPEEINRVLWPFFFDKHGQTRRNTGLDRYSLGLNQGTFLSWRRIVMEHGMYDLLSQLPPTAIESVLQHIRHSKTA